MDSTTLAQRIGEVLSGSGILFLDRGTHELKGLTGVRSLFGLGERIQT